MAPRSRLRQGGLVLGILLSVAAASAMAEVALNPNHPTRYVVQSGDTLWDIAGRFLRDPWRWGEIWDANRKISDPDLIFPGDVLVLSYGKGQPRIGVERGGLRVVKLTPRVRATALDQAIPVIPANVIAPFLTRPYVLDKPDLDDAPYVVGFPDEHIVGGLRDAIYVRSILSTDVDIFLIVRQGPAFRDPDSNEELGYEAAYVANAILERPGDPAKLQVQRSEIEVAIGDRLIPAGEAEPLRNFYPTPAPRAIRGRIISVLDGVTQIGQYNVVVIDRGSRDGVAPGQVFAVYQGGNERIDKVQARVDWRNWRNQSPLTSEFWYGDSRVVGWLRDRPDPNAPLPPHVEVRRPAGTYVVPYERSGILMVFRSFPRVSFALVMSAERPMKVLDSVGAPDDD